MVSVRGPGIPSASWTRNAWDVHGLAGRHHSDRFETATTHHQLHLWLSIVLALSSKSHDRKCSFEETKYREEGTESEQPLADSETLVYYSGGKTS